MQAVELDPREVRSRNILEDFVMSDYKIFIDTCSFLHCGTEKLFYHIIPLLVKYKKKMILPQRCYEEIKKHSQDTSNAQRLQSAVIALKAIPEFVKMGVLEIRGEPTDNFADNVFLTVFTKFRMTHKLLLITQDNNLAKDILSLNGTKSANGKNIAVRQINQYGFLSRFYWDASETDNSEEQEVPLKEAFEICTEITTIPDTEIVVEIPEEGKSVYTSRDGITVENGTLRLIKEISDGGEGIVYETNSPSYVAKIYKKGKLTEQKLKKIQRMLSKEIDCDGVCYPVSALFNEQKQFVGYLMPKAKGYELAKSVFQPQLFGKRFPNWKKRDTVELCVTILQKIKYLHNRNIILGDINPQNILVVSPKEVYFVDADSYQIEEFPCPVGTINYTAPELQGKDFGKLLRTLGNENFAVATLLFMIMLPGKSPYAQQGGGSPQENIKLMDFSYPLGEASNKKTPDGKWRFVWSHLTYQIKRMFYTTFRKGEDHSTEDKRYSVKEWLSSFEYYLSLLDSGKYGEQDKMSEEIFPTRFKKNPKSVYIRCKLCGEEVAEDSCQNGICRDCLNKGETYKCKRCGKELVYTNYVKFIKGGKKHELCQDCFELGNKVRIRQTCCDCGRRFDITNHEFEFYQDKGLSIPKRCPRCLESKKAQNQNGSYSTTTYTSNSNTSANSTSYDGKIWKQIADIFKDIFKQ